MAEKTTKIVAAVHANHPSGQRVRAGFLFTTEPREFEVTADQLKAIKADEFIHIYKGKKEEVEVPQAPVSAPETTHKTPETPEGEGDKTPEASNPDDVPPADTQSPVDPKAPATPAPAKK